MVKNKNKEIQELEKEIKKLKKLVHHDQMTGLYNRIGFREDVIGYLKELEVAHRRGAKNRRSLRIGNLSMVFFDLNDLKKLNDKLGHVIGDKAIIAFAKALKRGVRNIDIPCRWSGDEFVVALIGVGRKDAEIIVEKIKQAVSKTIFNGFVGRQRQISFSFGVSSVLDKNRKPSFVGDLDELINEADGKMYVYKKRLKSLLNKPRSLI